MEEEKGGRGQEEGQTLLFCVVNPGWLYVVCVCAVFYGNSSDQKPSACSPEDPLIDASWFLVFMVCVPRASEMAAVHLVKSRNKHK